MDLPAVGAACAGYLATSSTAADPGCRRVLVDLLRPVAQETANAGAEALLAQHGNLRAVLRADRSRLEATLGGNREAASHLRSVGRAVARCLGDRAASRPATHAATMDELRFELADDPLEQVMVVFTDGDRRRIAAERMWRGTHDRCAFHPVEVIRRALELRAQGIIVAHNHPSGDPNPSDRDIEITRRLSEAASAVGILVHDHVVVAATGVVSLRRAGLL